VRAVQAHHGVAQSGEGAADLAVAALTHANVPLGAAIGPETGEDEPARAIGQLDAVVADHLLVERFEWVVEPDVVFFDLGKLRMGHAVGKVAVVAEQKQAGAIGIEPANGLERVQFWRQKVVDGGLIPLLFARADVTDWLVEHNSAVGNLLGQWCALYRYQAAWLEAGAAIRSSAWRRDRPSTRAMCLLRRVVDMPLLYHPGRAGRRLGSALITLLA